MPNSPGMPKCPAVLLVLHGSVCIYEGSNLGIGPLVDLALRQVLEGRGQRGLHAEGHHCGNTDAVETNMDV